MAAKTKFVESSFLSNVPKPVYETGKYTINKNL